MAPSSFWAAVWAALAVLLAWPHSSSASRLRAFGARRGGELTRIGIAAVISSLSAYMRNGGTLVGAFEEQAGRTFATRRVSYGRVRSMLEARRMPKETVSQVSSVAYALEVSCCLSERLGCQASRCLDAVGASYRRMDRLARARGAAFAMPKATVKLLSALPVLTLVLGSLLGAHPLAFLLKPGAGSICLLLGVACYLLGLLWMRALLKDMDEQAGE
ncbi:pilus assembly protein [Bifidobacterium xylocopae]|nr:pilus assembly protein [Bifidobacterium xylocopae]